MAKKVLWRDNTMPPTNYLWLKIGPSGEVIGLFEWNGYRWVQIDKPSGSSLTFTDLEGNVYNISGMKETENGISLISEDGTAVTNFVSMSFLKNNYPSKTEVTELIREAVVWLEDTEVN